MLCAIYIPDLTIISPGDAAKENELKRVVQKYRSHPSTAFWKGADEPEWGKVPAGKLRRFYEIVHAFDPDHPVWITQAPRGTVDSLKPYNSAYDVGAIDIYPVSYPPGVHSDLPNKNISVTGDYAGRIAQVTAAGGKPFWMVLQICFSGVTKPGATLRFPTFPEERYMSYQSIIFRRQCARLLERAGPGARLELELLWQGAETSARRVQAGRTTVPRAHCARFNSSGSRGGRPGLRIPGARSRQPHLHSCCETRGQHGSSHISRPTRRRLSGRRLIRISPQGRGTRGKLQRLVRP